MEVIFLKLIYLLQELSNKNRCLLFIIITSIFWGCATKKATPFFGQMTCHKVLSFLPDEIPKNNRDNYFDIHLYSGNSGYGLVSMNENRDILFYSFEKKKSVTLPINKYFPNSKTLPANLIRDTLFLIDYDNKYLLQFKIKYDSVLFIKKYKLHECLNLDKYFLDPQYFDIMQIMNGDVYFSYGSLFKNNYYRDIFSYFKIPIAQLDKCESISAIKCFPTANAYRKGRFRNNFSFLREINDSICVYGFAFVDSLYLWNYNRLKLSKGVLFNKNSKFRKFQWKKIYDLGYVRWYDATTEENIKILSVNNKILLIKRVARNNLFDQPQYEYYLFDNMLNIITHNQFEHTINEKYCFEYENGFLIFDKNLLHAYYYPAE